MASPASNRPLRGYYCWIPLSLGICPGGGVVEGARGRVLGDVLWARPERDEDEQAIVRRLSRARKAPRDAVMRVRMIEVSWSGLRVPTIAVELGCSQKTVRCWPHRFNRSGLQGLDDLGGQGP
ncbi:helix-turn-helix domain-containing protein [Streptomyces sp. NPDC003006]